MLNENIPYIHGVAPERIRGAAERARQAFYASLAREFPQLSPRDIDPSEILAFESVSNDLAVIWMIYNSAGPAHRSSRRPHRYRGGQGH